jgi:hypothetical protein
MASPRVRKSLLSPAQLRALEAAGRGEVIRTFNNTGTTLTCASVNSKALWNVFRDGLIANGPRTGDRCTMILTRRGKQELETATKVGPTR